jgi:hypothetical protein
MFIDSLANNLLLQLSTGPSHSLPIFFVQRDRHAGGAEAGDVEGALWEALQKILDTLESEAAPRS